MEVEGVDFDLPPAEQVVEQGEDEADRDAVCAALTVSGGMYRERIGDAQYENIYANMEIL